MIPTKNEIKVANKMINILKKAGLSPVQMLEVIKMAREKFKERTENLNPTIK